MELLVVRYHKKPNYTIGKLFINGEYFCDTLEDTDRGLADAMPLSQIQAAKRKGTTAIPTGRYVLELTVSPRFGRLLPVVVSVKGFEGIRIHRGNTAADTAGCILVGENKAVGKVLNSAKTEERLVERMCEAKCREKMYLTVVG